MTDRQLIRDVLLRDGSTLPLRQYAEADGADRLADELLAVRVRIGRHQPSERVKTW